VTGVDADTLPPVTKNVAELEPCATVTVVGTLAAVALELDSEITAPPLAADPVRVMVALPD